MDKNKFKDFLNSILSPEQKEAIKKEFNSIPPIPAPVQMAEAKLQDGTVVKYDTEVLGVGSMVLVVTPEGELPAPQGEHTLENGDVIVVDETGKVTEIKPAAPVTPEPEMAATSNPLIDALKALMENKFEAQSKEIEARKSEVENLKSIVAKQSEALETFRTFFNSLIELPTAEPVKVEQEFSKKTKSVTSFLKK